MAARKKTELYAAAALDVFDTLGAGEPDATPLRLAELERSAARLRELAAMRLGVRLTAFRLEIRDIDAASFRYHIEFDPPLDAEDAGPVSLAERLGLEVAEHLHGRLATYSNFGKKEGIG